MNETKWDMMKHTCDDLIGLIFIYSKKSVYFENRRSALKMEIFKEVQKTLFMREKDKQKE